MSIDVFNRRSRIPAPCSEVFAWHARPGAIERLSPPWEPVEIVDRGGGIDRDGSRVVLKTRIGPFTRRWVAEHHGFRPGEQFRDTQVEGPFARWEHTHRFEADGEQACVLEDHIEYALPGGSLGRLLGGPMVRSKLESMFAYRHATTAADIAAHRAAPLETSRIAVTGSGGLVGSALVPFLTTGGHDVARVGRASGWDFDLAALDEADAVVHLAGESIAAGRWTKAKKDRIHRSRVEGTRAVAERLAASENRPRVLVCASAIGYYGDRGDDVLDESAAQGMGFLADVCRDWEAAAEPARAAGIRVVHLRFGVILSPAGGALAKMLTPFRLGMGGRLGSGTQHLSWISVDDAAGAILHAIARDDLAGPVNAVAPAPVTNLEFTKTLGRVLRRPTILPMPAFAARLVFGEMADELLLASTRVVPRRLHESRYAFRDATLEGGLRRLLGRS